MHNALAACEGKETISKEVLEQMKRVGQNVHNTTFPVDMWD
jgi:hypothetical protein